MNFNLKTNRLSIRPPLLEDVEQLFRLMSNNELVKFLTWEPHQNLVETRNLIENLITAQSQDRGYHWCICQSEKILGLVSLIDVRRKIRTWTMNRAELSYWIGVGFQGNGFATEASQAVVQFGFGFLNLHKIIIAHALENGESKKICNKLGFVQYAHEHDAFLKNGKWHDLLWYELIKKRK